MASNCPIVADGLRQTLDEERTTELIERLSAHGLQMEQDKPLPGEDPAARTGESFGATNT